MAVEANVVVGGGAEMNAVSVLEVIPVVHFPHIWKMILADADTLLSWENAVSLEEEGEWKRILDPKRKQWIFRQILPFLPSYLERNDVLKVRQVCRHWSEDVDEFIEKTAHDDHRNRADSSMDTGFIWKYNGDNYPYAICTDDSEFAPLNVDAFIKSMRDHTRNPIVGRGLVIQDENADDLPPVQLLEQISRFLPLFGHHLHYLHVESCSRYSVHEVTGLLTSVLRGTPNLRQLRLVLAYARLGDRENEMEEEIEVPHLAQLRTLQLDFEPGRQTQHFPVVLDFLRRHAPQLQRFDVWGLAPSLWIPLDWQDLRELNLPRDSNEILHSLLKMEAPRLSRLHLENYYYRDRRPVSMKEYQQVLESFPNLEAEGMVFLQE